MMSRRATALAFLGMLALAAAQGPPAAAAEEKKPEVEVEGLPKLPSGTSVFIPSNMGDATTKYVHAMVASQADMINSMIEQIHPGLHGPLVGLATMMMSVQEQLPNILAGKPPTEPSALVHEMFVRYANGTKTDADLQEISKGLDELFTHEYDAGDADRAMDLVGAKELFVASAPNKTAVALPQVVPNKTLTWTKPNVAEWPNKTVSGALPYLTVARQNFSAPAVTKIDKIAGAKWNDTLAAQKTIAGKQAAWDKAAATKVQPTPKDLNPKADPVKKEIAMATAVGNAYKNKDPAVKMYPTDWIPGKTTAGDAFWKVADNQTALLALTGILEGSNKNISTLPAASFKPFNVYKASQNATLQKDANELAKVKAAFPAKQGFDWLRPAVDALTADPIGDAVAPATAYMQFRDPTLFGIAKTTTTVSTKGTTGPKGVFDPSANQANLRKDTLKYAYNTGTAMSKSNIFNFSPVMFNYKPCLWSDGFTGASAAPELIRIRPEGIGVSVTGASFEPQLIDVEPHVIKIQAQGTQWNPDLINIEPYVISVAPRVELVGKTRPKPWQVDRPGAPAKGNLYKSQGGFKEDPADAARKTLSPPVGKPYTEPAAAKPAAKPAAKSPAAAPAASG